MQVCHFQECFVEGPAGSGKTTLGVDRVQRLMQAGIPIGDSYSVATANAGTALYGYCIQVGLPANAPMEIATVGRLARRMCELFWLTLVSRSAVWTPRPAADFSDIGDGAITWRIW